MAVRVHHEITRTPHVMFSDPKLRTWPGPAERKIGQGMMLQA
jgi:hypothetical protein